MPESKLKHINNGKCPKCAEIIDKYPNFNSELRSWFESFQDVQPSAHISCAGRGREEQEDCFKRGVSKAHYGQSSHNYNCALDFFVIKQGIDIYDLNWFHSILEPNLEPFLKWYGAKGAPFYELPHVEIADWKELVAEGKASLVEHN